MTPEEIAADPRIALPFEQAPLGIVVLFDQDIQWVRILCQEPEREPERWLVAPDNERGRNGAAFWVEYPYKVKEES